jgi:drug/metabolite transporter (DMT)-like permease
MTHHQLSPLNRTAAFVTGIVLILAMLLATLSAVIRWHTEPHLIRVFVVVGLFGVLGVGALLISMARRGVYDRRRDNNLFIGIALVMMGGLGIGLVNQGLSDIDMRSVFTGSVLLAMCGMFFVMHLMEQQHLTTLEKLEALERRLIDRAG